MASKDLTAPVTSIGEDPPPIGLRLFSPWSLTTQPFTADLTKQSTMPFEQDQNPALRWPFSNVTYETMRNDSQLGRADSMDRPSQSCVTCGTMDPNGAKMRQMRTFAAGLGLPLLGEEDKPTTPPPYTPQDDDPFSFTQYLSEALLFLAFGHSYFELSGLIAPDDGPGI